MNQAICYNNLKEKIKAFKEGKRDFISEDLVAIKLYLLKYKDQLSTIQFFQGKLQNYTVASCFTNDFEYELLDHLLQKLKVDIAIVIILERKEVLFKIDISTCKLNVCKLAQLLCDGECVDIKEEIAKGDLTPKFLKFTTKLTPCI